MEAGTVGLGLVRYQGQCGTKLDPVRCQSGTEWALGGTHRGSLSLGQPHFSLGLDEAKKMPKGKFALKSNTKSTSKTWSSLLNKSWFFTLIEMN